MLSRWSEGQKKRTLGKPTSRQRRQLRAFASQWCVVCSDNPLSSLPTDSLFFFLNLKVPGNQPANICGFPLLIACNYCSVPQKNHDVYIYHIYIHIICVFIYACIIFAGPTLFHTKLCSKNLQILLDPLPGTSINGFWLSSSTASQSPWWKPQKQKVRQVGSEQWPEHLFPSFVVFLLYSESRLFIVFFEAILLKVKTNGTECIKKLEGFLIAVSPMVLGSGHDFVGRHHVRGPSCDLTYRSIHSSGRKPMRLCGKKHHFWMPIRMFY